MEALTVLGAVAAVTQLADYALRTALGVIEFSKQARNLKTTIRDIGQETESLGKACEAVQQQLSPIGTHTNDTDSNRGATAHQTLWSLIQTQTINCNETIDDLNLVIERLKFDHANFLKQRWRTYKFNAKREDIMRIRERIRSHTAALQTLLIILNITVSYLVPTKANEKLDDQLRELRDMIAKLESLVISCSQSSKGHHDAPACETRPQSGMSEPSLDILNDNSNALVSTRSGDRALVRYRTDHPVVSLGDRSQVGDQLILRYAQNTLASRSRFSQEDVGATANSGVSFIEVQTHSLSRLLQTMREAGLPFRGQNASGRDIHRFIADPRDAAMRLWASSPALISIATRQKVLRSKNILYGCHGEERFISAATNRDLVQTLATYMDFFERLKLCLDSQEHAVLLPRYLQVATLLLPLLTSKDLESLADAQKQFYGLSLRQFDIEVLFLKVIPLISTSPRTFLETLIPIVDQWPVPEQSLTKLPKLWARFQRRLAEEGYLLPASSDELGFRESSWTVQWPAQGIKSSSVFDRIQLHGTRSKAFNEVPSIALSNSTMERARGLNDTGTSFWYGYRTSLIQHERYKRGLLRIQAVVHSIAKVSRSGSLELNGIDIIFRVASLRKRMYGQHETEAQPGDLAVLAGRYVIVASPADDDYGAFARMKTWLKITSIFGEDRSCAKTMTTFI